MRQNKIGIDISETLYESLTKLADNSGFESVDEFVNFVLDEVVRRGTAKKRELTDDEKKEIDKGLKEMGYKSS